MIDFSGCKQNYRFYDGYSGNKIGIEYQGDNYMVKFAKRPVTDDGIPYKNVSVSYSNSPISEYIGSHVYQIVGIDTHDTLLGTRNGKTVVACKDFVKEGQTLVEFNKIKTTSEDFIDSNSSGACTDLLEVLQVIDRHKVFETIRTEVKHRFWQMFTLDAILGNTDRNNKNWGILLERDKVQLAPVYDLGNCLNPWFSNNKIEKYLADNDLLKTIAYTGYRCIYKKDGRRINPFQYLQKKPNLKDTEILHKIFNRESEIKDLIFATCEEPRATFYWELIKLRTEVLNGGTYS